MTLPAPKDIFATDPVAQSQRRARRGSRNKLAERYFADMYAAWEEQGPSVIARAMFHDPVAVLGIIARLMPQKIEVTTPTDGMSDERLADLIELAERMQALRAGVRTDEPMTLIGAH